MITRLLGLASAALLSFTGRSPVLPVDKRPPFNPAALRVEKSHLDRAESLDAQAQDARDEAAAVGLRDRQRLTDFAVRLEREAQGERKRAAEARERVFSGVE